MKTYVVGDIQGCRAELARLLDALNFDPGQDRLWLVGDLVNRGPDSAGTLRLARNLGQACVCVLGNHDLSTLARAHDPRMRGKLDAGQRALFDSPDAAELLDWLRHRPLLHVENRNVLVHAGLAPPWTVDQARAEAHEIETRLRGTGAADYFDAMYGDEPADWLPGRSGPTRWRYATNVFTRMRFCAADGRLDLGPKTSPEGAGDTLMPWFAVPGRRSADHRILFGHWSTLGRVFWPRYRVWGLDTGCVWGGRLTALDLERGRLIGAPALNGRRPDG